MKPLTETPVASSSGASLEYAPTPPLLRQRRVRRGIAIVLLLILAVAGWRWGPAARDKATILYWQRQCMSYEPPANVVLYESDPAKAAALMRASSDYQSVANPAGAAYFLPQCQRKFEPPRNIIPVVQITHAQGAQFGPVTLFVHGMKTPSGKQRVVILEGTTFVNLYAPAYDLDIRLYELATLRSAARQVNLSQGRAYGGPWAPASIGLAKADPADPTHLTIPYSYNGQSGTIDGHLTDSDNIDFTVRDGPGKR